MLYSMGRVIPSTCIPSNNLEMCPSKNTGFPLIIRIDSNSASPYRNARLDESRNGVLPSNNSPLYITGYFSILWK